MLNERQHTGQFLIMSTLGDFSRVEVTVLSGLDLDDGTVMAINGAGKAVEFDNAIVGDDVVAGILYGRVNATDADTKGVIVASNKGDNVVDGALLNWKTGVNAGEQATAITAMESLGFVVENV